MGHSRREWRCILNCLPSPETFLRSIFLGLKRYLSCTVDHLITRNDLNNAVQAFVLSSVVGYSLKGIIEQGTFFTITVLKRNKFCLTLNTQLL